MIGVGLLTYNRPKYFKKCVDALIENKRDVDYIVAYNDGSDGKYSLDYDFIRDTNKHDVEFCQGKNKGCAYSKNFLLKKMIDRGCDHLFIIEDDIIVKSPDVFNRYIEAGKKAGFHHLNFALHGPANKGGYKFTDNNVDYYPHCVGAFSYYTKEAIEKAGYLDENFKNAHEHTEHTQRIGDLGLTSPFWAFADVHGSAELLEEIPESIDNSSIRGNKDWERNIINAVEYWRKKNPNCPV